MYAIGFASSLKNVIDKVGIELINSIYLFVGSLFVTVAIKLSSGRKRDIITTISFTFGILIIVTIINYLVSM